MRTHTKLLWLAGVLVAFSLLIGGYAFASGRTSPAAYVASRYERAPQLDDDDTAYTSEKVPSRVQEEITGAWSPIASYVDGSGIYLRYSDDVVAIFPREGGSVIRVDDAEESYRRYYGVVGGYWGWPRGSGEGQRGGGPGSGK